MSAELDFLARQWGAVSALPVPDKVKRQFELTVIPLLKVTPLTDPYIVDATNSLINKHFLSTAVEILQRNAKTAEELEQTINGTLKTKLLLKASTLVSGTAVAAVALVVLSFTAGSTLGAVGSEWWAKRDIAKTKAWAAAEAAKLEFLKGVNADLMTCKDGVIVKQDNGRRACFYKDKGWFIE